MKKSLYSKKYETSIAQLIKARKTAGITQTALAKKLGKTQSFVAKYEGGERRLDLVEFLEIAGLLKVKPTAVIELIEAIK